MIIGRQMAIHNLMRNVQPELISNKKELEDSRLMFKNLPELSFIKLKSIGRAILKTPFMYPGLSGKGTPIGSKNPNTQSLASRAKAMFLGNKRQLTASILGVGTLAAAGLAAYSLGPNTIQSLSETASSSQQLGGENGNDQGLDNSPLGSNQDLSKPEPNSDEFVVNTLGIEKGSWITNVVTGIVFLSPLALGACGVLKACCELRKNKNDIAASGVQTSSGGRTNAEGAGSSNSQGRAGANGESKEEKSEDRVRRKIQEEKKRGSNESKDGDSQFLGNVSNSQFRTPQKRERDRSQQTTTFKKSEEILADLRSNETPRSAIVRTLSKCLQTPLERENETQRAHRIGHLKRLGELSASMTHKEIQNNTSPIASPIVRRPNLSIRVQRQSSEKMTPVLSTELNNLLDSFLTQKRKSESLTEKALYHEMSLEDLQTRLVEKGKTCSSQTLEECSKKRWSDHLSPEEELMAAFICTSKKGPRANDFPTTMATSFKPEQLTYNFKSVFFKGLEKLSDPFCIVTGKEKNRALGPYWLTAFNMRKWQHLEKTTVPQTYVKIDEGRYFDTEAYKNMMLLMLKPFILEADTQAEQMDSTVYLSLNPLAIPSDQGSRTVGNIRKRLIELQIECYFRIIRENNLSQISDLDFTRFTGIDQELLAEIYTNSRCNKELKAIFKNEVSGQFETVTLNTHYTKRSQNSSESTEKLFVLQTYENMSEEVEEKKRAGPSDEDEGDPSFTQRIVQGALDVGSMQEVSQTPLALTEV